MWVLEYRKDKRHAWRADDYCQTCGEASAVASRLQKQETECFGCGRYRVAKYVRANVVYEPKRAAKKSGR
jgi:hypothetical protein